MERQPVFPIHLAAGIIVLQFVSPSRMIADHGRAVPDILLRSLAACALETENLRADIRPELQVGGLGRIAHRSHCGHVFKHHRGLRDQDRERGGLVIRIADDCRRNAVGAGAQTRADDGNLHLE